MTKKSNEKKGRRVYSYEEIVALLKAGSGLISNDVAQSLYKQLMERRSEALMNEADDAKAQELGETPEEKRLRKERLRIKQEEERRAEEERKRIEEEQRLAHVAEVTSMELPTDWENIFNSDERTQGVFVDSVSDGLIKSLLTLGQVDIEYISSVTGEDYKTVINMLRGSIYQNPETWDECFYKGWETADEYLSGNILRKWKIAKQANEAYNGYFDANVKILGKHLPATVKAKDIYVTLGSPLPVDIIEDFVAYVCGESSFSGITHDSITGSWDIPFKNDYNDRIRTNTRFGTKRMNALYIIEHSLNMRTVVVYDEIKTFSTASGVKRVPNRLETIAAVEKQKELTALFGNWVYSDEKRRKRIEELYAEKFGSIKKRVYDGSFLEFQGMNPDVSLYRYQKDGVARVLFSPNTLLAHDVGSGKTYIMIAAAMELKRMGISEKNLFVVPNSIVGQWESIFKYLYPSARVLVAEPRNFTPDKYYDTLRQMRDGDWDGIIIAYSCFDRIPLSKNVYIQQLRDEEAKIRNAMKDASSVTKGLRRRLTDIRQKIFDLDTTHEKTENVIFFDDLGITRLFVDEIHNYKNVSLKSKTRSVLGINTEGSEKCDAMLQKVHYVQRCNMGGGVVLATGTPITNSVTDVYVIQQYLQSGQLAMLDIQSFDSWLGTFAERVTEFEVDVDTSKYRLATRFAKFHNLPELTALLCEVADFHRIDTESGIPEFEGYTDIEVEKTPEFEGVLKELSMRADAVRDGIVRRTDDNMLMITNDGKIAALDIRHLDESYPFTENSKVAKCAHYVSDIYFRTTENKSTQVVFCDSSTPKTGFNMYSELKRLLVDNGIPEKEIAFVHNAKTDEARMRLFESVRKGDIRIIIGSTFKLGTGVNIQDKLIALHHLDVPWRPSDMTQREGRILRRGNENAVVQIFRYITKGSFDAYSWQILDTKHRFITGILAGTCTDRSSEDIEDTALKYAEVKAIAVGNPLIKKRVEAANQLSRYITLQKKHLETHLRLEKEKNELPARIANQKRLLSNCSEDLLYYIKNRVEYSKEQRKTVREALFSAVMNNVLAATEEKLFEYQGFEIILPANMLREKPFVWLSRKGRYYVELSDKEVGALIRIDNYLDGLSKHLEEISEHYNYLIERQQAIESELSKDCDYSALINEFTQLVDKYDKELGVKAA